jgi:hypothetical protein
LAKAETLLGAWVAVDAAHLLTTPIVGMMSRASANLRAVSDCIAIILSVVAVRKVRVGVHLVQVLD